MGLACELAPGEAARPALAWASAELEAGWTPWTWSVPPAWPRLDRKPQPLLPWTLVAHEQWAREHTFYVFIFSGQLFVSWVFL